MTADSLPVASRPAPAAAAGAPVAAHRSAFRQFLSELNPLQYLPVVGTIYRAVTGDTIPETARLAGSLVVSGLTGGPVGLAVNVGTTALEHLLGIDQEKIGTRVLAELGIGRTAPTTQPAARMAQTEHRQIAAPVQTAPLAWSPAQLTAYGVIGVRGGVLTRGAISGADVLNSLELARLGGGLSAVA